MDLAVWSVITLLVIGIVVLLKVWLDDRKLKLLEKEVKKFKETHPRKIARSKDWETYEQRIQEFRNDFK